MWCATQVGSLPTCRLVGIQCMWAGKHISIVTWKALVLCRSTLRWGGPFRREPLLAMALISNMKNSSRPTFIHSCFPNKTNTNMFVFIKVWQNGSNGVVQNMSTSNCYSKGFVHIFVKQLIPMLLNHIFCGQLLVTAQKQGGILDIYTLIRYDDFNW